MPQTRASKGTAAVGKDGKRIGGRFQSAQIADEVPFVGMGLTLSSPAYQGSGSVLSGDTDPRRQPAWIAHEALRFIEEHPESYDGKHGVWCFTQEPGHGRSEDQRVHSLDDLVIRNDSVETPGFALFLGEDGAWYDNARAGLAGHVLHAMGSSLWRDDQDAAWRGIDGTAISDHVDIDTSIEDAAGLVLGLSKDEGDWLFDESRTLDEIKATMAERF